MRSFALAYTFLPFAFLPIFGWMACSDHRSGEPLALSLSLFLTVAVIRFLIFRGWTPEEIITLARTGKREDQAE